ncbi:serine hydrolase domain-containing protein [Caulobacter mirabilis]|nr:serine hydrolase domain-containing protein [Caulobacter mirabilis]
MRSPRRYPCAAALAAFFVAGGLSSAAAAAATPPASRATASDATFARLDARFARLVADDHVPGLVYGVVIDGALVHVGAFGVQDAASRRPVEPGSVFRIASMTKNFTALMVLRLRDDGKLRLDDPVARYVPELRSLAYPTTDAAPITVRDLLVHSSGLVTDNPWGDRQLDMSEAAFSKLMQGGLGFARAPGLAHEYSNTSYAILGRVVANVAGAPYAEAVDAALLKPLGMTASYWKVGQVPASRRALGYSWADGAWRQEPVLDDGAFAAAGGLHTTAGDYGRYVAWLLSAWPPRDGPDDGILKRSSMREIVQGEGFVELTPGRPRSDDKPCPTPRTYGMGMYALADCELGAMLSHSGSLPGYTSYVVLSPSRRTGVFAFANLTRAPLPAAVWDAMRMLDDDGRLRRALSAPSPALVEAKAAILEAYGAGDIAAIEARLASNMLLDRPGPAWRADLGALRAAVGECSRFSGFDARSLRSASFTLECRAGEIRGSVLLAPTSATLIQRLVLTAKPLASGR